MVKSEAMRTAQDNDLSKCFVSNSSSDLYFVRLAGISSFLPDPLNPTAAKYARAPTIAKERSVMKIELFIMILQLGLKRCMINLEGI